MVFSDEIPGLNLFADTFEDFNDEYVVIGGIPTSYAVEAANLEPRLTEDIDLVIYSNSETDFINRLSSFISAGHYEVNQKNPDGK